MHPVQWYADSNSGSLLKPTVWNHTTYAYVKRAISYSKKTSDGSNNTSSPTTGAFMYPLKWLQPRTFDAYQASHHFFHPLPILLLSTRRSWEGFFHADPHRGNLLRTPEGNLAYLDFGMMANVTAEKRRGVRTKYAMLAMGFVGRSLR